MFDSLGGFGNIFPRSWFGVNSTIAPGGELDVTSLLSEYNKLRQRDDQGQPPMPSYTVGTQNWLNKILQTDPHVNELFRRSYRGFPVEAPEMGSDFVEQMLGVGQRQADVQARGVSGALASRGGGDISSALAMGAQARAQAATQGLAQGVQADLQKYGQDLSKYQAQHDVYQADRDQLLNALTFRYNVLQNIMSAHLGERGQNLQYVGSRERTQGMLEAKKMELAMEGAKAGAGFLGMG